MHIAVDLGAESGRVIAGDISNLKTLDIVHRFPSRRVRAGSLYWDILFIYAEIKEGLRSAFKKYGPAIKSIGIDSWGVDYGLIDSGGGLLGNPFHYRDDRTRGLLEEVQEKCGSARIYSSTGIQFMPINSIYQLYSEVKNRPEALAAANSFLMIPDLLNYWLCGVRVNEFSNATTTQLYSPGRADWDWELIEALDIPRGIFREIVPSGTVLGTLREEVRAEIAAGEGVVVIAPATHDTGSAVAAVPAEPGKSHAYLSSGTWSLLGTELESALITEASMEANFTNEGSASGSFRFLKNIMGLWILQECRREWAAAEADGVGVMDYKDITQQAELVGDMGIYIDVDDGRFLDPGSSADPMTARVQAVCRESGQPPPRLPGEFARVIFESLARRCAENINILQNLTGKTFQCLHVIGGGSRNKLLCRLTARAADIPVHAGPVEATALGNILVQALACGTISSLNDGRELIRNSRAVD